MKTATLFFTVLILFFPACSQKIQDTNLTLDQQIENLKTPADKKAFLLKVEADDQNERGSEISELMLQYGKDSKEVREFVKARIKQDSINLIKIDKYLSRFGHPSKEEVGEDAATVPWLVIHHSTDAGLRNYYFPVLYRAYLSGDIDDGAFTMYLNRTYEFTFRSRLQMENPYTVEAEIDQLVKALGLAEERAKVDRSFDR